MYTSVEVRGDEIEGNKEFRYILSLEKLAKANNR